jgi:histone H3/H4
MANKKILSLSAMEKIMKKAGAYRVSDPAKEALRDVLEEIGENISKQADGLSRQARRSTIKAEDIKKASKELNKSALPAHEEL